MKDAAVTAESNIGTTKTRKPRTIKPKPTNFDQALAMAQGLNLGDKANLVKELRRQLFADRDKLNVEAKEANTLLEGI